MRVLLLLVVLALGCACSRPPPSAGAAGAETDLRAFESLVRRSGEVDVPACLEAARDRFRASMAQTQAALNVRRPGEAREAYVEARKAARATYEEFNAEVQRQVPNVR
jgi:hypothetical protein